MKQKIFLTSALAMGVIAPAMAETFPSNGLMQQNKTYDNAATSTNMDGVYEGTVNATAEYDTIDYILTAGQYLPADSETITPCPTGSFCAGGTTVQYNQTTAQGIETCPTGFASSALGSSVNTQCYRACDINNMGTSFTNIAHATAVSGNDYYGAGTDTCEPTACENGWHVKTTPNLTNIIGVSEAANGVTSNDSTGANNGTTNMSNTILANAPMAFAVDYGTKGIIKGHAQCSTRSATNPRANGDYVLQSDGTTTTLPDSAGQYCYCQLDSYTTSGGVVTALSAPWVFDYDYGGAGYCADDCSADCAAYLRGVSSNGRAFRAAVFGSVQPGLATCEANVININWYNADANDISANNAGTATYGSDVRTPVKAQTIKGKTFRGWRFSAPEQTNLPN